MSLTFPSQMRRDARLGPPPVGPGALILPAGREERSGGKGLRREVDKVEKDKRTERSFITCSEVEEKRASGPGVSNILAAGWFGSTKWIFPAHKVILTSIYFFNKSNWSSE